MFFQGYEEKDNAIKSEMKETGQIPLTFTNRSANNNSEEKYISTKLSSKTAQSQSNKNEKSDHKDLPRRRLSWAVNEKPSTWKMGQNENLTRRATAGEDEASDDLKNDLMRLMIGEEHLLKVKVQYLDERTALNLQRPVNFHEVEQYFQTKYGRLLNFYYTTSTRELMIQVRNQQDLDHVIQLHERTGPRHRMKLILSQKREQSEQSSILAQPPMGIHSGIQESTLSETSSIWSLISSSSTKRTPGGTPIRMHRWAEEENGTGKQFETPKPPGNWREGRCLGRGAFGHVFVCLNVDTGEQLVVKKIFLHANSRHPRSRVIATLENELNLLGTLHHPNIVQYFGVVASPDCVNIFMELMAGGSLKDQISEYGALGESMCIHFATQILNGLAYLHSKEIVHRDIKPANILRHTRAQVKIGDFGSAKFLQAICSEQGVDIQGTPHYTAPEIIRDNHRYEPRSDVWSVGITLVEMMTTQTPWAGIDPTAVHLRIAFDECPPLSQLNGKISKQFEAAIELMLKKEPEERPNATELLKIPPFLDKQDSEKEEYRF